jgi:molybdenum cofactor cytidylyltransferase
MARESIMDVVAVLLAAGDSERMGRSKALLDWHGQPLLSHQLHEIQRSRISECVVVLGNDADRLVPLVRPARRPGWKARHVVNPRHREGKVGSILAGLAALWSRPDGALIASVDQPLEHRLIDALIDAAEGEWGRGEACCPKKIVLPVFHGRRGHPVLFSADLLGELMGISEEGEGLKAVVRRDPSRVLDLPWDAPEILLNLNRPVDVPPARIRPQSSQR